MTGNVEGVEVGGILRMRGTLLLEDLLEDVGAVGDEAVDTLADEVADGGRIVGVPGIDAEAGFVERGDVELGVVTEEDFIFWREDRRLCAVGFGMGTGGGHEGDVRVGVGHGGLLGGEGACGEENGDENAESDGDRHGWQ
jgi:hypothetical protein